MAETIQKELADLNISSMELFEQAKTSYVRNAEEKKKNLGLVEVAEKGLLTLAKMTLSTKDERSMARRLIVRLNSAVNYLQKAVRSFDGTLKGEKERTEKAELAKQKRIEVLQKRVDEQKDERAARELKTLANEQVELEDQKTQLEEKIEEVKKKRGRPVTKKKE